MGDSTQAQLERYRRRFRVLRGVMTAAQAHKTVEGTVTGFLDEVCTGFNWPVGLYFTAGDENPMSFGATELRYPQNGPSLHLVRGLHERSREGALAFDTEMRRARDPQWVPNVTVEPSFESTKQAIGIGVRGLVGIPIQGGGRLYGLVEFFTREEFNPGPDQVDYLAVLGNLLGAAVHFHEVERRMHKLLQDQELVFQHVNDPVYIVDRSGRATFANQAAARLFGVPKGNLLGTPIHDTYHRTKDGATTSAGECPIHRAPARLAGNVSRRETYRTANDRDIEVEAIASPFTVNGVGETLILLRLP